MWDEVYRLIFNIVFIVFWSIWFNKESILVFYGGSMFYSVVFRICWFIFDSIWGNVINKY